MRCLSANSRDVLEKRQRPPNRGQMPWNCGYGSRPSRFRLVLLCCSGCLKQAGLLQPLVTWYSSRQVCEERIFVYFSAACLRTQWTRRVHHLGQKYSLVRDRILAESVGAYAKAMQQSVRDAAGQQALAHKETLSLYRQHKSSIKADRPAFRGYSRGAANSDAAACAVPRSCGNSDETIEHFVLQCDELGGCGSETGLPVALGFEESVGDVQDTAASKTSRRLEQCRARTLHVVVNSVSGRPDVNCPWQCMCALRARTRTLLLEQTFLVCFIYCDFSSFFFITINARPPVSKGKAPRHLISPLNVL